MALTKRGDKGSALTYTELDDNFTHLGGDGSYHNGGVRVGGFRPGEIIESFSMNGDGQALDRVDWINGGTTTLMEPAVVTNQLLSSTYQEVNGSKLVYTPPPMAKRLLYSFEFKIDVTENSGISHYYLEIDNIEVQPSARTYATNYASSDWNHGNTTAVIHHVFDLAHWQDVPQAGQFNSWTSDKTLRVMGREYSGSYEVNLHSNTWWNGTGASGTYAEYFTKPLLTITAFA